MIERIEETPDTVITLTSGTKYVVGESIDEITEMVRVFRASLFNLAVRMADHSGPARSDAPVMSSGAARQPRPCDRGR